MLPVSSHYFLCALALLCSCSVHFVLRVKRSTAVGCRRLLVSGEGGHFHASFSAYGMWGCPSQRYEMHGKNK